MNGILNQVTLPAGSPLFAEGEAGTCAYLIKRGRIEIFLARNGGAMTLALRGPGEIVGEMAIIDNRQRSASARIVEDCELICITGEQIAHRIADTDPILRMCLGVVIGRYRETIGRLNQGDGRAASREGPSSGTFEAALNSLSLESDLRRGIQQNELELYYQPIIHLPTRRLAGFEALVRWHHPERGLVSPGEFIPLAEASGLIVDITDWGLAEIGRTFPVILAASVHNRDSVNPLFMTVNISGHDLMRTSFLDNVAAMLASSGLAPDSIKLEVTESVMMKEPIKATVTLEQCRLLGLHVALDDFGTGYSSLSHLSTMPITTIKIDRSFILSAELKPMSGKIINMILRLAQELDVPVVAEGIETESQESIVRDLGCAFGQGYLFGRPAPLTPTLALVHRWTAFAAIAPLSIVKCA